MAVTKYEICSRALNTIGIGSIESFNDDTPRAAKCADIWDTFTRYLLSIYPWYFTEAKIQLGRLTTTPVNQYQYEFQLPGDNLRLHAVYNSGSVGAVPIQDYTIFGERLLCNESAIWVDYQKNVIAEGWPYWFVQFAIKALALEIGEQIPVSADIINRLQTKVWGTANDNGRGGMFGFSMNLDSKLRPAEPIRNFELIDARFV